MTVEERLLSNPELLRCLRNLCPKRKGDSVTLKDGNNSVTLTQETRKKLDETLLMLQARR